MKKLLSLSAILIFHVAFFSFFSFAQIRGTNITVTVTPDHKDWNYKVGETVTFTINVLKSGTLLDDVDISYEMGPEMYPTEKKNLLLKDGTAKVKGTMKVPGFYRLSVTAHVNGKDYKGLCTAAFSPEKIVPTAQCPTDFDEFWSNAITQARNTALEPTFEYLPERSNAEISTYHVSFQNDQWGRRVYGILNVPNKPGKYPALLRVPGAGVRPYTGDQWFSSNGAIVLEIGIHGIPVTNPQSYYDQIFSAALANYWEHGTNDRDKNYYKHVITGCIRSIDFIEALSSFNPQFPIKAEWDGKNLAVTGSSQGGFLSLATAGLDKRVSCFGAVHAAMCDYEAAFKKVACGWPHYFYYNPENADPRQVEQSRYYDGVNFARRITVPGYFSFGYNDDVVPPTTAYGTYNIVKAEKTLSPYQQTMHFWYQEQWDEWNAFLMDKLGMRIK